MRWWNVNASAAPTFIYLDTLVLGPSQPLFWALVQLCCLYIPRCLSFELLNVVHALCSCAGTLHTDQFLSLRLNTLCCLQFRTATVNSVLPVTCVFRLLDWAWETAIWSRNRRLFCFVVIVCFFVCLFCKRPVLHTSDFVWIFFSFVLGALD